MVRRLARIELKMCMMPYNLSLSRSDIFYLPVHKPRSFPLLRTCRLTRLLRVSLQFLAIWVDEISKHGFTTAKLPNRLRRCMSFLSTWKKMHSWASSKTLRLLLANSMLLSMCTQTIKVCFPTVVFVCADEPGSGERLCQTTCLLRFLCVDR